jgi:hypothetical protein
MVFDRAAVAKASHAEIQRHRADGASLNPEVWVGLVRVRRHPRRHPEIWIEMTLRGHREEEVGARAGERTSALKKFRTPTLLLKPIAKTKRKANRQANRG